MAALAHLEDCARCSAEVDALSTAADQLLHLAPAVEPPVGFEAGVFERLGLQSHQARGAWRPVRFSSARLTWRPKVAGRHRRLCALVVAFGVGALVGHGTQAAESTERRRWPVAAFPDRRSRTFISGGHDVGRVMVYAGNPTWLFMFMDDPDWQGALRCEVVVDQGPTVTLGRFWLADGKGAWAASVDQPAGRLSRGTDR